MITKEQIDRYFRQQCEPQEAEEISRYLEVNPDAVIHYFEEDTLIIHEPSAQQSEELWNQVYQRTHRTQVVKAVYIKMLVAASFVLTIGLSWYLYQWRGKASMPDKTASDMLSQLTFRENTSSQVIGFYLPDSSYIKLLPGSSVKYLKNFDKNKRDISLSGAAHFVIAKDIERPFTVYSGKLATRALGTEFLVKMDAQKIKVVLYEGSVIVSPAAVSSQTKNNATRLQPGDELVYDSQSNTFTLHRETTTSERMPQPASDAGPTTAVMQSDNWVMFNNQDLAQVLNQLEVLYGRKIHYSSADLKGITFIGRLDRTDSLHKVLKSIALLNQLKVTKIADGYRIGK